MRKLLMLPLVGLLVVGGASAAMATSEAVGDATDDAASAVTRAGSLLSDVLAELVGEGVIDQQQADAIVDRVDQTVEEKRAELEALREQIAAFLEDGVITSEELEQLPEDHPWRNLDEFLADGQLTVDELRQLGGPLGLGRCLRGALGPGGFGGGPSGPGGEGGWFMDPDDGRGGDDASPEASPETSPETSPDSSPDASETNS